MQAYSQDLRDRVLRALERKERPTEIAERFEVSRVYVYNVKRRMAAGDRSAHRIGGHRVSRLAEHESLLRGWIATQPDLTLQEMAVRLAQEVGLRLTPVAIWQQLNRWGLTFKKNPTRRRAKPAGHRPAAATMGGGAPAVDP